MPEVTFGDSARPDLLHQVKTGMTVVDAQETRLGVVDRLQFGDENAVDVDVNNGMMVDEDETEMERMPAPLQAFVSAFEGNELLSDELKAMLVTHGYLHVDGGMFSGKWYVTPDQIARVDGYQVYLNVSQDELIRA
ncbi:hypothetical protein FBR02_03765 [Anaerolineae bacterium CFX9]|jgi:hypothetical protein|nr:hypothetical protein [Anaerolineae bacterium CFX9]